jgi:hypothetical protein
MIDFKMTKEFPAYHVGSSFDFLLSNGEGSLAGTGVERVLRLPISHVENVLALRGFE